MKTHLRVFAIVVFILVIGCGTASAYSKANMQSVVINIDGAPRMVSTDKETVGELLEDMENTIDTDYILNDAKKSDPIEAMMTLSLTSVTEKTVAETKEVPFKTIERANPKMEMTSLLAPIVQVCDAISGARPGARREIVEAYIKRLNDLEQLAMSYPGVTKTYAIQAGRELRVIVGADKIDDKQTECLSADIAKKIQDEMTYPGQVKITVIRETRAVSFAK